MSQAVTEAAHIVRGKTGSGTYAYGPDHQRIYTYTKFQVTDVYKGDVARGSTITLRAEGGIMNGMQLNVPGSATFREGEDVVLLLEKHNDEDDSYDVSGMTTGKYNVRTGEDGKLSIVNSMGGSAIYNPGHDPRTLSYNSSMPLSVFKRIARGDAVPEASQNQFAESDKPAPSGAFEADEPPQAGPPAHPAAPVKGGPVAQLAGAPEAPRDSSLWVPVSFVILAIGSLVLVWWLRS